MSHGGVLSLCARRGGWHCAWAPAGTWGWGRGVWGWGHGTHGRGQGTHGKGHREGDVEYGAGGMGQMAGGTGHTEGDKGHRTWGGDVGRGHVPYGRAVGRGAYPQPCHLLGAQHPKVPAGRCCPPPQGTYWAYWERRQGLCTLGMSRMRPAQAAPAEGSPHLPEHPPEPCGPPQLHREGGCSDLGALPCSPTPLLGSPYTRLGGDPWEGAQPGPCPVCDRFFWGGGNIFLALVGKYWRGWES